MSVTQALTNAHDYIKAHARQHTAAFNELYTLLSIWRLPAASADAGVGAFFRHIGAPERVYDGLGLSSGGAALAEAVAQLEPDLPPSATPFERHACYATWLRELFLSAYHDYQVPLLRLAIHVAQMRTLHCENGERRELARQTLAVFVPLMEMLGLWELRGELADISMAILHGRQRDTILRRLIRAEPDHRHVYSEIVGELFDAYANAGIGVEFRLARSKPYRFFVREVNGEDRERLVNTVRIDVRVDNDADCARFRELAGRVLTEAARARFDGPLTLPRNGLVWQHVQRFNGYARFFTVFNYNLRGRGTLRVKLLLDTRAMSQINKHGIVAARLWPPEPVVVAHAWWDQPPPAGLFDASSDDDDMVVVFSPVGETFRFPRGSTPIDYAYGARSDVGDHCVRIWVNGAPASIDRQLAPRDLIAIDINHHYRGPLPEWEHAAYGAEVKATIRRAIEQRRLTAENGRQQVFSAVRERLASHGLASVPEREIERYVERTARDFNYVDVRALYTALANPLHAHDPLAPSPASIALRFVVEKLAAAIVDVNGNPIARQFHRIRPTIYPAADTGPHVQPGVEIVGRLRRRGTPHEELTIYPRARVADPLAPDMIPLNWRRRQGELIQITIDAVDRRGLLGDLLQEMYPLFDQGATLRRVVAGAEVEPYAHIQMQLAPGRANLIDALRERLQGLISSGQVRHAQIQHETADWPNGLDDSQPAPYTTGPVSDPRLFVGREDVIARLLGAIDKSCNLLVVCGPSRIGKTSVLRWLHERELAACAAPILVNIGGRDLSAPSFWQSVADGLREGLDLYAESHDHNPPRVGYDPHRPFESIHAALERLARWLRPRRLVLLVDEFTALQTTWPPDEARCVLSQLKALVEQRRDVVFVLGVHDPVYAPARALPLMGDLLQVGMRVSLDHLAPAAARQLIRGPAQAPTPYDDAVVDELARITDGHPYLLQYLLMELHHRAERVMCQRVRLADLESSVRAVLREGDHLLYHLRQQIPERHGQVARAVAALNQAGTAASAAAVAGELRRRGLRRASATVALQLEQLRCAGVLARADDAAAEYRFRIPLLGRWIAEYT